MRLLCLCVLAAGCTAGFHVVPATDWQVVSPAERGAIDRSDAPALAGAQRAVTDAAAAVAQAQRPLRAPAPAAHAPPVDVKPDEAAHEALEAQARTRIAGAMHAWWHANLAWRADRLAAARVELDVVRAQHEVRRAESIDQSLTADESYDVASYRGQLARYQDAYMSACAHARRSHQALVAASAELAARKEALAQLVRDEGAPRTAAVTPRGRE